MQPTIDSVRRQAVTAEAALRDTNAAEQRILESAQQRLEAVDQQLQTIRPTALSQEKDGDQYMKLTTERGQLLQVIAQAKHHLSGGTAGRDSTVQASNGNV